MASSRNTKTRTKPSAATRKSARKTTELRGRFAARWMVLLPFALILLMVLLSAVYYTPLRIWYREARQERVLAEHLAAVQAYNDQLRDSITSLETTEGIKAYARESLGLVEEGENIVIVTRNGRPISEATASERQMEIARIPHEAQPFGAWTAFLDAIFRIELPAQER
ncbi:MAG: septum formation initiator family protein [Coriobacteriia bacterium]|nr:septum formation initiator family protein [Coriobacteriia bacterium]